MENSKKNLCDEVVRISGVNPRKCMKCGKCSGTCPAYDEMEYHPHQFVYMVETGDIEPLLKSKSIYRCLTCFACVERCPRGVAPAAIIEAVRQEVIRAQGENRVQAEEIPSQIRLLLETFRSLYPRRSARLALQRCYRCNAREGRGGCRDAYPRWYIHAFL